MRTSTILTLMLLLLGHVTTTAAQEEDGPTAQVELLAEGLTSPVVLVEAPDGTGRRFIADQAGLIHILTADGTLLPEPFLDLRDRMVELRRFFDERGLLGLAFHPDYAENGRFFVYYSAPTDVPDYNHESHISEFSVSEDPNRADPTSERILLVVPEPQLNHNAGAIAFGPEDGYLYIALGDGGNRDDEGLGHVEDWYEANAGGNGQDIEENLLGSILRIDIDRRDEGLEYAIPADNPFVEGGGRDEIYAYGLRNPYRFSFDMGGEHMLLAADVGQELYEEVSVITKGGNYGWNVKEGTHCFDAEDPTNPPADCPETVGEGHPRAGDPLIDPVIEFLNAKQPGGLGFAVVGGYVYRGDLLPQFRGRYLFGTWRGGGADGGFQGRVFVVTARPRGEALWKFEELQFQDQPDGKLQHLVLAFGQDLSGEVYVLTSDNVGPRGNTGKVYQLTPPGNRMAKGRGQHLQVQPLPEKLALSNAPNPFGAETTIQYELPSEGRVVLKVYDLLGREVEVLVDGVRAAGVHQVRFDAARLPSGMYLYRLETDEGTVSRSMVLH